MGEVTIKDIVNKMDEHIEAAEMEPWRKQIMLALTKSLLRLEELSSEEAEA